MSDHPQTRIAIFASGNGSNAQQIIQRFKGHPFIHIALVVCNKPGAGVIQKALDADIPVLMIEKERFFTGDAYLRMLREQRVDFIVLAGFLWKIPAKLINAYPRKIINIHPALLPKYGGKGMYGSRVHEAVIAAGEEESGITIHYVDEHYDNGDVIFQMNCRVFATDGAETLAERIHALEHQHYPTVIEQLLTEEYKDK